MKENIVFFCIGLCFFVCSYAQKSSYGTVYADINGNGIREQHEIGIENVSVTNGVEVVLTDKNGFYRLPARMDQIIAVIKPSGYQVPVNKEQLPLFYYIFKPYGSPILEYPGVNPTGNLPKTVDFPLVPKRESDSFAILVLGDPQVSSEQDVDYFSRGVIEEIKNTKQAVFGLTLGDMVADRPDLFNAYIHAIKRVGIPWYNVLGNHDINYDVKADSLADESFEAHFGPSNYAFNYGKVHFLILDNIIFPDPRGWGLKSYWGGFTENQFRFIENDLKCVPKDYLVVTAFHIPINKPAMGEYDGFRPEDRKRFLELLKDFPHVLTLSAHTHNQMQYFLTKEDGWSGIKPYHEYNVGATCGNWYSGELNSKGIPISTMTDGTPKGYAFLSFDGNAYKAHYKVVDSSDKYQIGIFSPRVVEKDVRNFAGIYANFFMGGSGDTVMIRVDSGKWTRMKYTQEKDPSFLHLLEKWDYADTLLSGTRPTLAEKCLHLWSSDIPTDLKEGSHEIEVMATDMYGQIFTQKKTYNIVERVPELH